MEKLEIGLGYQQVRISDTLTLTLKITLVLILNLNRNPNFSSELYANPFLAKCKQKMRKGKSGQLHSV